MHKAYLKEIEEQSGAILDHIEFIRENAGLPPFKEGRATTEELFALVAGATGEFSDFAEYHVPIYIGRCIVDELDGRWFIEDKKHLVMYGKPYVGGFGNIGYENAYLPYLTITERRDIKRIDRLREQYRRAHRLRERFRSEFGHLSGSAVNRKDIETRCVELGILPSGKIRFRVDRARVPLYCRELKIKLKKG